MLGSLVLPFHGSALAQCAVTQPIPASLAENEETFALACGLGWVEPEGPSLVPCPAPDSPQLKSGSETSQSVVLTAVVPAFMDSAHAVHWIAMHGTSTLWIHRSTKNILAEGLSPGDTVEFGAPGLHEYSPHWFQVAFEHADGRKTCYSNRSLNMQTTYLSGDAPDEPEESTHLRIEEEFRRPRSRFTRGTALGQRPCGTRKSRFGSMRTEKWCAWRLIKLYGVSPGTTPCRITPTPMQKDCLSTI